MNILEEVQTYVADKLNNDIELSGLCPFLVENKRDIDFEIKQALGKQGVVGLVMTPKATYAGSFEDFSIAWQIDELEVDIVENVLVNRGKKDGYVTGQDAAMRLFDVLCPLSGENEGKFSPVSYEEGEDNSLLVNKCLLKCLVHKTPPTPTIVKYLDGTTQSLNIEGTLSSDSIPNINNVVEVDIGEKVTDIGNKAFMECSNLKAINIPGNVVEIGWAAFDSCTSLSSVNIAEGVKNIKWEVFLFCTSLTSITIPGSVMGIGENTFDDCPNLAQVTFTNKTIEQVQGMENYSWYAPSGCVFHCSDGDITL